MQRCHVPQLVAAAKVQMSEETKKIDANERIEKALQAAKEAVGKTEANFSDQIRSLNTTIIKDFEEVLFQLPGHAVAMIDELKQRQGLRNRSQVLLQLIEGKGATAQQMT